VLGVLLFLVCNLPFAHAAEVSQGTITLKTYDEGLPDPNPSFDQLQPNSLSRFYPYTFRNGFTTNASNRNWRALFLENEYLKCTVLPDLGGHLYTCIDKRSGRSIFHAADAVKKQWVGLRGAWISTGIELNFPVGHSWTSISPVDFGTQVYPDGSAGVWVGNVDRVYGMQWRVAFVLRPGTTVLEQRVTLYNRSDVRRRYYWWANAAVKLESNETRVIFPTLLTATHGFTEVDTWPVTRAGVDISVMGNTKEGLGLFTHLSREPFLAAYQPASRTGLAHYAEVQDVPGKKFWTWGTTDKFAATQLSDNGTTYIEIQAGLFRDQETYGILEPQESRAFTEYWMPAAGMGGISRANTHAVLNFQRGKATGENVPVTIELNPNHSIPGARIVVRNFEQEVFSDAQDLTPATAYSQAITVPASGRYTFQLLDKAGMARLEHTEGPYNAASPAEAPPGPQPQPVFLTKTTTEQDYLDRAAYFESQGNYDQAASDYQKGLSAFPSSTGLRKGQARLSIIMGRDAEGALRLASLAGQDPESQYYLGLALARTGRDAEAEPQLRAVLNDSRFARSAALQLAYLLGRTGRTEAALAVLKSSPLDQTRGGAVEVALLRSLNRLQDASVRLRYWQAVDPADTVLRYEAFRLGKDDPAFWRHLAADPERVLNLAEHLMALGAFGDALDLLGKEYPKVDSPETEPGAVRPQEQPLIAYYRGYCRAKTGDSAADDYRAASMLSVRFVFPSRIGSLAVLQDASSSNANDATAHYLLGSLYLSLRMTDEAISEWQKARALRRDLPSLQRNLGRALLDLKKDAKAALPVLEEGAKREPGNQDLIAALERARAAAK
jgi:tetratricopeptide (TPR) repeat protein